MRFAPLVGLIKSNCILLMQELEGLVIIRKVEFIILGQEFWEFAKLKLRVAIITNRGRIIRFMLRLFSGFRLCFYGQRRVLFRNQVVKVAVGFRKCKLF